MQNVAFNFTPQVRIPGKRFDLPRFGSTDFFTIYSERLKSTLDLARFDENLKALPVVFWASGRPHPNDQSTLAELGVRNLKRLRESQAYLAEIDCSTLRSNGLMDRLHQIVDFIPDRFIDLDPHSLTVPQ